MANGFSPDMYSGGAVVFDTQPFQNYFAQTMARRQAKDEALDQYYQNAFKNVNPAGARTQDIPMFTEKVNEWQKFYQQNRDAIKNPRLDGGAAQSEFYSRLQDAQGYIQQSKNEAKKLEDILPILRDPEKRSRLPESVINDLAAHDLPLSDANRKSFNPNSLIFDPKPLDAKTEQAYFKGLSDQFKMDEVITGTKTDPKTFKQTVITTASLSPEAKLGIANRGVQRYGTDQSFKKHIDDALDNPASFEQLNQVFKKQFGKDIETGEDGAVAYTLGGMQESYQKQKSQADWKAQQDYLQGQRLSLLNRRLAAEKAGGKELQGWVNEHVANLKDMALMTKPIPYKYRSGAVAEEYDIPMDATLANVLARGTGSSKVEPSYLRYNPQTGQFRPIFPRYEEVEITNSQGKKEKITRIAGGKDGKFSVDEELSRPISEGQLVLALGGRVTPTQRTVEMRRSLEKQGANKPFKINGQTYSRKQLNDMGYDDDEIEQFLKEGTITQ